MARTISSIRDQFLAVLKRRLEAGEIPDSTDHSSLFASLVAVEVQVSQQLSKAKWDPTHDDFIPNDRYLRIVNFVIALREAVKKMEE